MLYNVWRWNISNTEIPRSKTTDFIIGPARKQYKFPHRSNCLRVECVPSSSSRVSAASPIYLTSHNLRRLTQAAVLQWYESEMD
jgi:hypothetical protein